MNHPGIQAIIREGRRRESVCESITRAVGQQFQMLGFWIGTVGGTERGYGYGMQLVQDATAYLDKWASPCNPIPAHTNATLITRIVHRCLSYAGFFSPRTKVACSVTESDLAKPFDNTAIISNFIEKCVISASSTIIGSLLIHCGNRTVRAYLSQPDVQARIRAIEASS
jgi:hypothetical protein